MPSSNSSVRPDRRRQVLQRRSSGNQTGRQLEPSGSSKSSDNQTDTDSWAGSQDNNQSDGDRSDGSNRPPPSYCRGKGKISVYPAGTRSRSDSPTSRDPQPVESMQATSKGYCSERRPPKLSRPGRSHLDIQETDRYLTEYDSNRPTVSKVRAEGERACCKCY